MIALIVALDGLGDLAELGVGRQSAQSLRR